MQRIKFCHVIDSSNSNPLLYNSIKYSDREKFDYTVITLEPENGLQEQMAELGVRSFSINYTSRRDAVAALWQLYKFFRREKIQIVQTHLFNASLIGLSAARLAGVQVTIFTGHHSHEVPLYNRKVLTFVDGLCGRLLAKHTIAPSNDMKQIFIKHQKIPKEKIEVLNHGFDLPKWRRDSQRKSDIKEELGLEGKIIFGAVGRIFWVKGFEELIKAFAKVAEKNEDIVLLIVGGGDSENLQRLIESKELQGKVFLTGRREDIAAVMNEFDVFVHSSLAESFGMVFIEAFALGKPVISTRVGIAPEIIENGVNGFLVETPSNEALAEGMQKMLDKKDEWQKMGEAGKKIAEKFSVLETQKKCDEFYLRCLESR